MNNIAKGPCWAVAVLLNALGNRGGLIDDTTADTLFVALPALGVMSLNGSVECRLWRRRKEV